MLRSSQKTNKVEKTKSVMKKVRRTVVIDPSQIKPEEFHLIGHLHDSFYGAQSAHHESAQYLAGNKILGKSYKVNLPGQKAAQKIKFTRAITVCKRVEVNPAALTAEQAQWVAHTLLGHDHCIQAGHVALAAVPHPTKSELISYRPIVFTKDVVMKDVVKINVSNLTAETEALLQSLLSGNPDRQFFDATNNVTGAPVRYLVAVNDPANPKAITYQPVCLSQSLVRFERSHAKGHYRYAVCEAKPLGTGSEGAVYLAGATLKPVVDADGDFKFALKAKPAEKTRVVKQMSPARDEDGELKRLSDGSLFDPRSQNAKAKREGGFLQRMTMFHAKSAVLSADDSRAALVMRRITGKEWMDYLIEDCGQFDVDGKYIRGTGNIFTVDQRIDMTIMVGEAIMAVHAEGIIHRDLKPENIVMELDANNNPINAKVIDFGLAKYAGEVGINENCGSVDYAAPEIFKGGKATISSDAFSFAKTLKTILWQALSADRYDALADQERYAIKSILAKGTEEQAGARATVADIVKVFADIKAGRQRKANPAMQMN